MVTIGNLNEVAVQFERQKRIFECRHWELHPDLTYYEIIVYQDLDLELGRLRSHTFTALTNVFT